MKKRKNKNLIPRIVILIVLVAANTLAWFIYATKVDNNIDVHVRSWNVVFESGDQEITNIIDLDISSVYPGMEDYEYELKAYNQSEVAATMSYKILEARILNTEYITQEGMVERGETITDEMTSDELEEMLAEDYPFSITFGLSNTTITQEVGLEYYTVSVIWPYESNDDEEDTFWGTSAYNYKQTYPTRPSITLKVKIYITQAQSTSPS